MRRSPMDAALIQPWWSRSSRLAQHMRNSTSKPCEKNGSEDSRFQPLLCTRQEEKREEENEKRSKRKAPRASSQQMVHKRQVGVTKALRLVLLWILLGTRMQMVTAVEEEISIRQETNRMIEKVHVPLAGGGIRYKRMKTCDRVWRPRGDWAKRKSKNSW